MKNANWKMAAFIVCGAGVLALGVEGIPLYLQQQRAEEARAQQVELDRQQKVQKAAVCYCVAGLTKELMPHHRGLASLLIRKAAADSTIENPHIYKSHIAKMHGLSRDTLSWDVLLSLKEGLPPYKATITAQAFFAEEKGLKGAPLQKECYLEPGVRGVGEVEIHVAFADSKIDFAAMNFNPKELDRYMCLNSYPLPVLPYAAPNDFAPY